MTLTFLFLTLHPLFAKCHRTHAAMPNTDKSHLRPKHATHFSCLCIFQPSQQTFVALMSQATCRILGDHFLEPKLQLPNPLPVRPDQIQQQDAPSDTTMHNAQRSWVANDNARPSRVLAASSWHMLCFP